jgi:DNA gyrase subunit A
MEDDVCLINHTTHNIHNMKLTIKQQILSLLIAENDQQSVLVATENGYGKRTVLSEFRHSGRGTQGVKAIAISERNGLAVAARLVTAEDEIMLITTGGVLIRTRVKEIRDMGRAAQGVTLINLGEGEKLSGLEKIVETDDDGVESDESEE